MVSVILQQKIELLLPTSYSADKHRIERVGASTSHGGTADISLSVLCSVYVACHPLQVRKEWPNRAEYCRGLPLYYVQYFTHSLGN